MKLIKTAIYGGTFNPPTLGHLHVIKEVFNNTTIDKIIIAPDGFRLDKNYNINIVHRSNLIDLFIDELTTLGYNIELEKAFLEGKNKSETTTYDVDKYFISKLKQQPYHIFGTDISSEIKKWSGNPDKYIQKKLKKIFIPRKGYIFDDFELENYKLIATKTLSSISSTKIKEKINKNQKIDKLVMNKIEDYIKLNNLY